MPNRHHVLNRALHSQTTGLLVAVKVSESWMGGRVFNCQAPLLWTNSQCGFWRQTASLLARLGSKRSFFIKRVVRNDSESPELCCCRPRLLGDFPWCSFYSSLLNGVYAVVCHWLCVSLFSFSLQVLSCPITFQLVESDGPESQSSVWFWLKSYPVEKAVYVAARRGNEMWTLRQDPTQATYLKWLMREVREEPLVVLGGCWSRAQSGS